MQYAPRIHEVPFAERFNIVIIEDVSLLDCSVLRLLQPPHDPGRVDRVLVVIETMYLAGTGQMRRQRMDAAATADIEKIQSIEASRPTKVRICRLAISTRSSFALFFNKARPILPKLVAFGR